MNFTQKTRTKRILVIGMLVLFLAMSLTSCMGRSQQSTKKLEPSTTYEVVDGGNLTDAERQNLSTMLASVYDDKEFDVQDMLIAAKRGYNMLAEGFDDANLPAAEPDRKLEFAKLVITEANKKEKATPKAEAATIEKINEQDLDNLIRSFQTTVDVNAKGGVVDRILGGIGVFLNWITRYLGFKQYIIGICIFAVIVEILMIPFAIKQQKNSIRQAKLRPKEMAIRNKYKGRNDQVTQQKVQKEIQDLYQRENYSPFGGCLPLLLQMPILLALYRVVMDPLHYMLGRASGVSQALSSYFTAARAAGGMGGVLKDGSGTIELLSNSNIREAISGIGNFEYFANGPQIQASLEEVVDKLPNFKIFGLNFGLNPGLENPWLLIVPVLTFVVYFFSMRLTRKFTFQPMQEGATDRQTACSNTMMDISMPAMSTFFAFVVPGIIGVYWIFRSILGTLKQFIMSRVMPLPKFTEEDYKAAAKELAGKAPKVEKSERAGTVRSLHHIDDEDYEDTRERALKAKAAMEEKARAEQEEKAKKTPFGLSELKKDRTEKSENKKQKKQDAAEKNADEDASAQEADADEKKDQE